MTKRITLSKLLFGVWVLAMSVGMAVSTIAARKVARLELLIEVEKSELEEVVEGVAHLDRELGVLQRFERLQRLLHTGSSHNGGLGPPGPLQLITLEDWAALAGGAK